MDDKLREIIENDILDPSAARTTFDDIAALDSAKRVLREAVTLPLLLPDLFTGDVAGDTNAPCVTVAALWPNKWPGNVALALPLRDPRTLARGAPLRPARDW